MGFKIPYLQKLCILSIISNGMGMKKILIRQGIPALFAVLFPAVRVVKPQLAGIYQLFLLLYFLQFAFRNGH